jgi:hypothetical protein
MQVRFIRTLVAAVGLAAAACTAGATTYDASSYPFSYMGVTGASVTITTSATGTFTTSATIAQFLNGTSFNAVLTNANGVLVALDNSNSTWSLDLAGAGASASFNVDAGRMSLSLLTPQEFSGAVLVLKSADGRSVFQMRQENNITDYAFVNFTRDAMFGANANQNYNQAFGFLATTAPVPELPSGMLLIGSLPFIAAAARRRLR